jgi:hypothetical protein
MIENTNIKERTQKHKTKKESEEPQQPEQQTHHLLTISRAAKANCELKIEL